MVRMVVTSECQYYGRRMQKGEEFDCEPGVAPVYEKMGWARPIEQVEQRAEPQYETRVMTARTRSTRRLTK